MMISSKVSSCRGVMALLLSMIMAILLLSTVVSVSFFREGDETGVTISTISMKPKRVFPETSKYVGVWELTWMSDGAGPIDLPNEKEYGPFLFHFEQVSAGEGEDAYRHRRFHYLLELSANIGPNTLSAPVRVFPDPNVINIEVGPVSSTHNQETEELEKLDSILKEYLPQMAYAMEVYEPFGDSKNGRLVLFTMEVNPAGFGLRLEAFDNEDKDAEADHRHDEAASSGEVQAVLEF